MEPKPDAPATTSPSSGRVTSLSRNQNGRDFCVGDIHGMFDMLDELLDSVQFDTEQDRLISVGDMVDRGPASITALEFLEQSWFYAVRGNHEDMLIQCFEHPDDRGTADMWLRNGGDWWQSTGPLDREKIYEAARTLPWVIQLETPFGQVGVVHADVPPGIDWQAFVAQIEAGDNNCEQVALWSRTRAKLYQVAGNVPGIERIYCGHNIVDKPLVAGNVRYIDTGAFLPEVGRLTMLQINHFEEPAFSVWACKDSAK